MDQIDDVCSDYVQIKGEQSIVLKMKVEREKDAKVVLTNPVNKCLSFYESQYCCNAFESQCMLFNCICFHYKDEIGLKEWLISLKSTHKNSLELLSSMAKKATKIYGTDNRTAGGITTTTTTTTTTSSHHSTPVLNSRNGN